MKILFICSGNVGRSQMAETMFNTSSDHKHAASSAGTNVIRGDDATREGQPLGDNPDAANVITAMSEIGINISENKRKHITPEMVSAADHVVIMVDPNEVPDYVRAHASVFYWNVRDPFGEPLAVTRDIRGSILSLLKKLLITLP
jgi:arsenate reductase